MGWILGAFVNALIYWTIVEDEDKCQDTVRKTITQSIEMANRGGGKAAEELTLITSEASQVF
jgi:hypothetical protein